MQDFYNIKYYKITMFSHIYDALAVSAFAHICQLCAPLSVFLLKCVRDVSGRDTLFCVGREGCGYTACGVGSGFPRWRQLKFTKDMKSDTELVCFLLDL